VSDDGAELVGLCAADGDPLRAVVATRVPVFRELPDGSFVRVVFGVASCEREGAGADPHSEGLALFEQVQLLPR